MSKALQTTKHSNAKSIESSETRKTSLLTSLETINNMLGSKRFLIGENLSYVDVVLFSCLSFMIVDFELMNPLITKYPLLVGFMDKFNSLLSITSAQCNITIYKPLSIYSSIYGSICDRVAKPLQQLHDWAVFGQSSSPQPEPTSIQPETKEKLITATFIVTSVLLFLLYSSKLSIKR